jgi:ribosomal protein S18 acetylase RimI-like enzyme
MVLDNPIWHALDTEQVRFAERHGDAARFPPAVTALAGLRRPAAIGALAALLGPGEVAGVFADDGDVPASLRLVDAATIVQMIHDGPAPIAPDGIEELGVVDAPTMLALAEMTRPGPFGARTHELGRFLGLRVDGRVIAMAGQRMRLPGHIEISAVCTDPAHLGRGHAARLMTAQLAEIRGAGAAAFLHVRGDNARAIGLYERLGFRERRRFRYLVVAAAA